MTDHEIALAAAKDAREQAARASDPSKRAAWNDIAARWMLEAERFAPPQPWFASYEVQNRAARGLAYAMMLYNVGVILILGAAGLQSRPVGIALWPAVILHAAMSVWCVASLRSNPSR